MPIIPLIPAGQAQSQAPLQLQRPPQLQKGASLRVNLAGVAQNFAAPLLPESLADRSGGEAMAESVQKVGQILSQVSGRMQDSLAIKKTSEASLKMDATAEGFEQWKDTPGPDGAKPSPETWAPEWERRSKAAYESIMAVDMPPAARAAVRGRYEGWHQLQTVNTTIGAAKESARQADSLLNAEAVKAAEAGDMETYGHLQAERVKNGVPPEAVAHDMHVMKAQLGAKQLQSISTQIDTEARAGSLANLPGLIEKAKAAGAKTYQWKAWEQTANHLAANFQQAQANEVHSQTLGSILTQRANGLQMDAEGVDALVKMGRLDEKSRHRLLDSAGRAPGASQGEFQALITKVTNYDPAADAGKLMRGKYDLHLQAATLGLDQEQAARFTQAFETATTQNATPEGRVASALKAWGREHIESLYHKSGLRLPSSMGRPATPFTGGAAGGQPTSSPEVANTSAQATTASGVGGSNGTGHDRGDGPHEGGQAVAGMLGTFEDQFDLLTRQNKGVPPGKEQVQALVGRLTLPYHDHLAWSRLVLPGARRSWFGRLFS